MPERNITRGDMGLVFGIMKIMNAKIGIVLRGLFF